MTRFICYFFALLASIGECQRLSSNNAPTQGSKIMESADARFALDLLGKAELCNWNCIFSPFSIKSVLMMVLLGFEEGSQSQKEVLQGLRLNGINVWDAHDAHSSLLDIVQASSSKESQLNIANNVFINNNYQLKSRYSTTVRSLYGSSVEALDFGDAGRAVKYINSWVANQTHNHITNLLSQDQISQRTATVLVNAMFFKGIWQKQFDAARTIAGSKFYMGSRASEIVTVDMMTIQDEFCFDMNRGDGLKFDVIELPYGEGDIVMTILKPYAPLQQALAEIQEKHLLHTFLELNDCREVELYMPKFSITQKSDLKSVLKMLNIERMFNPQTAELSQMVRGSDERLYISEAVHQAKIEVDEKGTKAAASTAMTVMFESAIFPATPIFRINQPFFFIMYHKPSKTILFMGQVVNPSQEE